VREPGTVGLHLWQQGIVLPLLTTSPAGLIRCAVTTKIDRGATTLLRPYLRPVWSVVTAVSHPNTVAVGAPPPLRLHQDGEGDLYGLERHSSDRLLVPACDR